MTIIQPTPSDAITGFIPGTENRPEVMAANTHFTGEVLTALNTMPQSPINDGGCPIRHMRRKDGNFIFLPGDDPFANAIIRMISDKTGKPTPEPYAHHLPTLAPEESMFILDNIEQTDIYLLESEHSYTQNLNALLVEMYNLHGLTFQFPFRRREGISEIFNDNQIHPPIAPSGQADSDFSYLSNIYTLLHLSKMPVLDFPNRPEQPSI